MTQVQKLNEAFCILIRFYNLGKVMTPSVFFNRNYELLGQTGLFSFG